MSTTTSGSKVERVIKDYSLEISGEELETRWTEDRDSVRDLAHEINVGILDTRLRNHGIVYDADFVELLTTKMMDKDAVLTEIDLKERGIDVDSVVSDFVTYQTVHNYLTNYRGAELETETRTPAEIAAGLNALRGRTESRASNVISGLRIRDQIASPEPIIKVDIRGVCPKCESSSDLSVWARGGSCVNCGHGSGE